jgi:hypothetical protein
VAAVHGATYILGRPVESLKLSEENPGSTSAEAAQEAPSTGRWKLRIADIEEEISADWVVGSSELMQQALHEAPQAEQPSAAQDVLRCLLVLDRSLPLTAAAVPAEGQPVTPPDTALVVFPPGVLSSGSDGAVPAQAVSVLIMGEGTFSCPKGQCECCCPVLARPHMLTSSPRRLLPEYAGGCRGQHDRRAGARAGGRRSSAPGCAGGARVACRGRSRAIRQAG